RRTCWPRRRGALTARRRADESRGGRMARPAEAPEQVPRSRGVMKAAASTSSIETTRGDILAQAATAEGHDKNVTVGTREAAILKAAQSVFGPTRELEARFNDDTGQVDLFQYMTVVDAVEDPERQISIHEVTKRNLDAELGEELGFQVFWRLEDAKKA